MLRVAGVERGGVDDDCDVDFTDVANRYCYAKNKHEGELKREVLDEMTSTIDRSLASLASGAVAESGASRGESATKRVYKRPSSRRRPPPPPPSSSQPGDAEEPDKSRAPAAADKPRFVVSDIIVVSEEARVDGVRAAAGAKRRGRAASNTTVVARAKSDAAATPAERDRKKPRTPRAEADASTLASAPAGIEQSGVDAAKQEFFAGAPASAPADQTSASSLVFPPLEKMDARQRTLFVLSRVGVEQDRRDGTYREAARAVIRATLEGSAGVGGGDGVGGSEAEQRGVHAEFDPLGSATAADILREKCTPEYYADFTREARGADYGERPCSSGKRCVCMLMALQWPDSLEEVLPEHAFVCREFLLPSQKQHYDRTRELPVARRLCLPCNLATTTCNVKLHERRGTTPLEYLQDHCVAVDTESGGYDMRYCIAPASGTRWNGIVAPFLAFSAAHYVYAKSDSAAAATTTGPTATVKPRRQRKLKRLVEQMQGF